MGTGELFLVAAIIVASSGLLQLIGIQTAIQGRDRIEGTIGNPVFFAAYLLLSIIVAGILFFNAESKPARRFYISTILIFITLIFFSASRGALLSLLIGLPVFLSAYILFSRPETDAERRTKRLAYLGIGTAGLLLLSVLIMLWVFRESPFVKQNDALSRLANFGSLRSRTTDARFINWQIAWTAFTERPVLGWGQENYF